MTDHDDVRMHASARADGEAYDAALLDAHLPSCAECRAYDDGLARLTTLTAALPREPAPDLRPGLARRVRRRRGLLTYAPALAAATAAAVALTVLPSGRSTFGPPDAAAAEPLRALRSVYLERTVTGPQGEIFERIWFRAPASVRVDRILGGTTTTRIETPGLAYDGEVVTRDARPTIPLPEPLSPTVSLLGRDTGPGPVIAGRATRTVVLEVGGQRRTAYVDTERALALGADEVILLGKRGGDVTKEVTRVDRDPVIPDDTFDPPAGATTVDGGFRATGLDALGVAPRRLPEGFEPVLAGRGPEGESALFADGSLPLLVTTRPMPPAETAEVRSVVRDGRTYAVTLDLYAPPSVAFARGGVTVTVVAPLPLDALVALAHRMYPPE